MSCQGSTICQNIPHSGCLWIVALSPGKDKTGGLRRIRAPCEHTNDLQGVGGKFPVEQQCSPLPKTRPNPNQRASYYFTISAGKSKARLIRVKKTGGQNGTAPLYSRISFYRSFHWHHSEENLMWHIRIAWVHYWRIWECEMRFWAPPSLTIHISNLSQ